MSRATKRTYFLLCPSEKLVKIGESITPMYRVTQLRLMNAAPVEALCVILVPEKELHERFAIHRHHGEWFMLSREMVEYLREINEPLAAHKIESLLGHSIP